MKRLLKGRAKSKLHNQKSAIWNEISFQKFLVKRHRRYLHTNIPTYLNTYIPTYIHIYLHHNYMTTYIPTYLHIYLHTYLPGSESSQIFQCQKYDLKKIAFFVWQIDYEWRRLMLQCKKWQNNPHFTVDDFKWNTSWEVGTSIAPTITLPT